MKVDFCKQNDKKKRKTTLKLPPPKAISRPKTKKKERKKNQEQKQSHLLFSLNLSANPLHEQTKTEILSKQEEKKEIS